MCDKQKPCAEPTDTLTANAHHGHFHTHDVPFKTNLSTTPYIITISLCFHSIFEGIAIGLQKTTSGLTVLLIGICLHKCAEGFAMGTTFVRSDIVRRKWIPLLLTFSIIVPIGVCVGLGLSKLGETATLISSIMGAFAAGAFLYVSLLGNYIDSIFLVFIF